MSIHRPFEDWILGDIALAEGQSQLLRDHVAECAACRTLADGWSVARRKMTQAPAVRPNPGFADRWFRLQASRAKPRRTGTWAILAVSLGASLAAAGLVAWGLATAVSSPSAILQLWIRQLVNLSVWVRVGGGILEAASGTLSPSLLAGLALALMLGWAGLIGVWLISLRRIAYEGVSS